MKFLLSEVIFHVKRTQATFLFAANIAENLSLRDVDRWRGDSVINPASNSSIHCTKSFGPSHDTCERGNFIGANDAGSVILDTSYTTSIVPLFLKG